MIGGILLLPTLLPLWSVEWWWVRIWDFPRAQLAVLHLVATAPMLAGVRHGWTALAMSGVLALCLLYQVSWIVPYLPLAPVQTQPATRSDQESSLSMVMANVLMTNRA